MGKNVLLCAVAVVLLVCSVPVRASKETPRGVTTNGAEAEASKPGLFSGTFADSLWTVVAFVTLVVVLSKVAWKPLLAGLNARQSHIEQQLKSAEDSRQRAEKMLEDYRQQGQTTIRQATEEAQRHHQQMIEQTREEILALRRRAHEEVESAQAAAMEELWRQTGEIVLRVGSEVLGRALNPQDNQRLIDEAVTRIKHDGGL
jgi:F-type H+-transporting ATPase subunit b